MRKKLKDMLQSGSNLADGFEKVLKEVQKEYEDKYERVDNAEKLAYMEIEREFEEKKNAIEKQEKKATKELKDYLKLVDKYSTFKLERNDYDIIDILVDITSLYMGEEYEYDEVKINLYEQIVIKPTALTINTNEKEYLELIDKGIVLSFVNDEMEDKINFYQAYSTGTIFDSQPIELRISENSEKHKFILEFIDLVVKYRIEKNSDEISFTELKRLEQAFIYSKKEEIDALNRKRSQDEREELEKKIEERDALLDKYIDDNFDVIDELPSEVALGNVSSSKVLRKLIEANNEAGEN